MGTTDRHGFSLMMFVDRQSLAENLSAGNHGFKRRSTDIFGEGRVEIWRRRVPRRGFKNQFPPDLMWLPERDAPPPYADSQLFSIKSVVGYRRNSIPNPKEKTSEKGHIQQEP